MINYRKMAYKDWNKDSFVNLQRQLEDEQRLSLLRELSTTGPEVKFIDRRGTMKIKVFKSEKAMERWIEKGIENGTITEIVAYLDNE
jgi:hypothetical protein